MQCVTAFRQHQNRFLNRGHFLPFRPVLARGQCRFIDVEKRPHLKAGSCLEISPQFSLLRVGMQRMFPLGRSPCNLLPESPSSHLDRSCSPSCFSERAMSPSWYSAIRFQRRHRRRRRMLPCSADGARDGDGVGDDGREKPARREGGKEGRERGRREEGSRLGKVQRLRSTLRTEAHTV